jgi:hypothetical protein
METVAAYCTKPYVGESALNPMEFQPLPLLGNPHVQTIVASLLSGPRLRAPSVRVPIRLEDDDELLAHDSTPNDWRPGDPIAVLVHGLGGSHQSGYMHRMARRLLPQGVRTVRLDLRGCGEGMALAKRPYHGGCSADVRAAIAAVSKWCPASPVALLGFSLGGNIALKLAGELAVEAPSILRCVAAVSPPIDMVRCADLLAAPRNRFYEHHYVRDLTRQVRQRQVMRADEPRVVFPRPMTMRLFDDLYTAPRWSFDGAIDYYRKASSVGLIPRITIPTLILTAKDDPFVDSESFAQLQVPDHIEVQVLSRGGHLGFLGRNATGGIRWAEQRVASWVLNQLVRSPI